MKYGIIYLHRNKLNGKCYVGQTIQSTKRRFRNETGINPNAYKTCTVFYAALLKYGWANFETTELVSCANEADLNFMEEYFIKHYNSVVPNGYNTMAIIDNKIVFSAEVRKKLSDKAKARVYPPEFGEQFRKQHILNDLGQKCKNCTDCKQTKELSLFSSHKSHWDKLTDICKDCARERTRKWRAANPAKKLSPEEFQKSYETRKESQVAGIRKAFQDNPQLRTNVSKARSKPIKATDDYGKVLRFPSALAAKASGYDNTNIGTAIKNKTKYRGYLWEFDLTS